VSGDATRPDEDEVVNDDGERILRDAPLALYSRLAEVSIALDKILKAGDSGEGWTYVRAEDVLLEVRNAMNAVGLIVLPAADNIHRSAAGMTTVGLRYKLIDTATGQSEEREWRGTGSGQHGLYTAYTGALKYFLLDLFQLPTFDDPEKPAAKPLEPTPLRAVGDTNGVQGQQLDALLSALDVLGVSDEEQNAVGEWGTAAATSGDVTRRMARLTNPETSEQEVKAIVATAIGWKLSQGIAAA
jgi:hypothetical protein